MNSTSDNAQPPLSTPTLGTRLTPALGGAAFLLAIGLAVYFLVDHPSRRRYELEITGGSALGRRDELAHALSLEAASLSKGGLQLQVVPGPGSLSALDRIERGELDLALVQGGLRGEWSRVRLVSPLVVEPLHLLVREDVLDEVESLDDLRGRSLNLSRQGSGTRQLALEVLRFADLDLRDYEERAYSYQQLEELPERELPDAAFMVSTLPSEVAAHLVAHRGYRLLPLPFAAALSLEDAAIEETEIPAYTYGVAPPVPPQPIRTVGTRLLLVARDDVDPEPISRLLSAVFEGSFGRQAQLKGIDRSLLHLTPAEFPLHEGTRTYLRKSEPMITAEAIDNVESLRSFFVSCAVAGFLIWRWQRRRRLSGFEHYITEVNAIEKQGLEIDRAARLDLALLLELRTELSAIKTRALDEFAQGELMGEELLASFLAHVSDVRQFLDGMILKERDRLEELAQVSQSASGEMRVSGRMRALWNAAAAGSEEPAAGPDQPS